MDQGARLSPGSTQLQPQGLSDSEDGERSSPLPSRLRFATCRFAYQRMDEDAVPDARTWSDDRRLSINLVKNDMLHADVLDGYFRICDGLLPKVDCGKLIHDTDHTGAWNIIVSKCGSPVGGATVRLVGVANGDATPTSSVNGATHCPSGLEALVLDVLLFVVRPRSQGGGYGKGLANYVRCLAAQQAVALGVPHCYMAVQSDFAAVGFWERLGLRGGDGAVQLVEALNRWRPRENTIYYNSTPLLCTVPLFTPISSLFAPRLGCSVSDDDLSDTLSSRESSFVARAPLRGSCGSSDRPACWVCARCTYLNAEGTFKCELCQKIRGRRSIAACPQVVPAGGGPRVGRAV